MEKLPKSEVNYSRGMIHSHCGPCFTDDKGSCRHFIGRGFTVTGACQLVQGPIEPIMWCKEFLKLKK